MPTAVEAQSSQLSARTTISVRVTPNIGLNTLQSLIGSIVGRTGCLTCGLLGVDLVLAGDPPEAGAMSQLPGVQSVSIE